MATIKKRRNSRAAKMRKYFTENPTATPSEVAKKFETTYSIAYMCRRGMQQKAVKDVAALKTRKAPKTNALSEDDKDALAKRLNPEAVTMTEPVSDPVNHPAHYKVGGIETIDFIEAKSLTYHLGNAVKYISRADHKGNRLQDLEKAKWYLERAIAQS
jgi:hypothetical protein